MATYRELQAEAEKLLAQAEAQRIAEMSDAMAVISASMAEHGITLGDLREHMKGMAAPSERKGAKRSTGKTTTAAAAKYKDPKSEATWTGHGRAPAWMKALEDSGKSREQFLIKQ